MIKPQLCILILISLQICLSEKNVNKTQLVFGFMTHRHGDRAPLPFAMPYITDKEVLLDLTTKHGYGQLTDSGRRRGYELGKFIRNRYNSLLSHFYNKSEIYIRSTDSTRTKMTVLAAMAAVYPPGEENWSSDVNWTPVPYTTLPVRDDDMLSIFNCPVFINNYFLRSEIRALTLDKYHEAFDALSKILNVNITRNYGTAIKVNDAFNSQMSLGIPFRPEVEKHVPEIRKAANEAMEYIYGDGDTKILSLEAGVLLREFFIEAEKIMNGKEVPRVRVYSAHDLNVFQFSSITRSKPGVGVPFYGSLFSLELRKASDTGRYFVVPVYLEKPNAEIQYLHVDGCDDLCEYNKFRELTFNRTLDVKQWRTLCKYTEDLEINSSDVD